MDEPTEDEVIDEVAQALSLSESETDDLKLSIMETHEKAQTVIDKTKALGHRLSIKDGEEVFVNVAWLGTLMLIESQFTMAGEGGCPPHMRVIDFLNTTIVAAVKNIELDTTPEGVVD